MVEEVVSAEGVLDACERIKGLVHVTPVITSDQIDKIAGCEVVFKCEHLQKTGSFKARGVTNSVKLLQEEGKVNGVITHSSGNHGQALAWAAAKAGLSCCVVVPKNSAQSKIEAIREYGCRLELCENTTQARIATSNRLAAELGYGIVESHNAFATIHGQGTMAPEICSQVPDADAVLLAVGGGGMAAGVAQYLGEKRPDIKVYLVVPTSKCLASYLSTGVFDASTDALDTIADGIRVHKVNPKSFPVLQKYCKGNTEDEIRSAMRLIWTRTKQRVEPTAALPLAGLLKMDPKPRKAVLVLCGGNVDLDFLP